MPFGKHRGELLSEIPTDYLRWLLGAVKAVWLRDAVRQELDDRSCSSGSRSGSRSSESRSSDYVPPFRPPTRCADPVIAAQLVAAGRRALAKAHHPDRAGGNPELMKTINAVADWLEGLVSR